MANFEIKDKNYANALSTGDFFLVQTDPDNTRVYKKFPWGTLSGSFASTTATATGGVTGISVNGGGASMTGLIGFSGAGNVSVSRSGQTLYFTGNTGAYANFLGTSLTGQFAASGNLLQTGILLQTQLNILNTRTYVTGISSNGGLGATGLIGFSGAGYVSISRSGQTLFVSGNTGSLVTSVNGGVIIQGGATISEGQLLIGASGTNSFEQGSIYPIGAVQIISGSGTLGIAVFNWVQTTGTGIFVSFNTGYICSGTGTTTLFLPTSAALGSSFRVTTKPASGIFKIAQNAGQKIYLGTGGSTVGVGGFLLSNSGRAAAEILCVDTDRDFQVISYVGVLNLT